MLVAQSCLTLSEPMDCSLPGLSLYAILQARILQWVSIPFFSGWIFLTQGSNWGLLHYRQILYHLSHQWNPYMYVCVCIYIYIYIYIYISSVQFSHSVVSDSCDPMNRSTPGLPVYHQLLDSTQTHVYWVGDAIQPSHPLSSPSPPALNPSQHQDLFKWVRSSRQVAKVLQFQFQYQSFKWTPRTDLL